MKSSISVLIAITIFFVLPVTAQKNIRLSSPDNNLIFSFQLVNKSPQYNVSFKEKELIKNAVLSLTFEEGGEFKNNLRINKAIISDKEEKYELVVGKTKSVDDLYREAIIPLEETVAPFRH